MHVFKYTNKGSCAVNEDYVLYTLLPSDSHLLIVADGMGGYAHGDVASQTIADAIATYFQSNYRENDIEGLITEAVSYANDALMMKKLELSSQKMGAVLALLFIMNDVAYVSWMGDSRVYLFRDGKELFRTEDHSLARQMSRDKILEASLYERYAAVVTKAIMGQSHLGEIPVEKLTVQPDDVLILCSDGFYKQLFVENFLDTSNPADIQRLDSFSENMHDNYSFIRVVL